MKGRENFKKFIEKIYYPKNCKTKAWKLEYNFIYLFLFTILCKYSGTMS